MISIARGLAVALVVAVVASMSVGCSGAETTGAPEIDVVDEGASADALSRARFTRLRSGPTGSDLKAFYKAGKKFEDAYLGVYRFNKAGPEATDREAREKRIKEVMHRYMCGFFDESIDIGRNTGARRIDTVMNELRIEENAYDNEAAVPVFRSALEGIYDNDQLDILSGGASGNNTVGEVMGVYDIEHNEILFFGFTNCGSDS